MADFKLGVFIDNLERPFDECLDLTAQMGAQGVQFFTTTGELAPENLSAAGRRALLAKVRARGLEISALCGDLHCSKQIIDPAQNAPIIEKTARILELAADLNVGIVTTHLGTIPEDTVDPVFAVLQDVCGQMVAHAARCGVTLAIETGTETAAALKALLDAVGSPYLAVNMDPANLVMQVADDPAQAVRLLGDAIVHTHAKDGRMVPGGYDELRLGTGDVDYQSYIAALKSIGYSGYITVERESGDDRVGDVAHALNLLRKWM